MSAQYGTARPVTILKRVNLRGPSQYTWHVMQGTWEVYGRPFDTQAEAEAKRDAYVRSITH